MQYLYLGVLKRVFGYGCAGYVLVTSVRTFSSQQASVQNKSQIFVCHCKKWSEVNGTWCVSCLVWIQNIDRVVHSLKSSLESRGGLNFTFTAEVSGIFILQFKTTSWKKIILGTGRDGSVKVPPASSARGFNVVFVFVFAKRCFLYSRWISRKLNTMICIEHWWIWEASLQKRNLLNFVPQTKLFWVKQTPKQNQTMPEI